ncbi:MAG: PD40 domain-containing protein [Anaerolineales bacterium]|nr:PD40 domain-containing protein [Anaerolineales bacterium]
MKTWLTFILLTLFVLTGCAAPSSASPTPTIVRLHRSALTPTTPIEVMDTLPPATATPAADLSSTSTFVAAPPTLTVMSQPEAPATPNPTATAQPAAVQAEIITAGLNVREGPGVGYASIGTAAQGDILTITGVSTNGNWLQIKTKDGKSGWISGQATYTHILGSVKEVPVVETVSGGQPSAVSGQSAAAASAGKLIFATRSGGDLYSANMDGTDLQKLASGVIDPVVSPDGTQVAYTRWDGANMGVLYVLDLDSGSERAVASDIARPKSPTWSQDGQEIIISFQHGGTVNPTPECREFDSDDGMQLPGIGEITSFHMSNDGGVKICFIRTEDLQWGLRQINLATGQAEDLPADLYSFNPTWDPQNSSRVIYDGQRGLMQLDIASGDLQSFTGDVRDTAPVFSPDGSKLALTYKQHDHWEVYTYDLATGARQRLTKPSLLADPQYSSAAPAWSPDGSQIAFVTNRTGQWEIWVMNADGSNPHALFTSEVQAQLGLNYQGVNERLLNWVQ